MGKIDPNPARTEFFNRIGRFQLHVIATKGELGGLKAILALNKSTHPVSPSAGECDYIVSGVFTHSLGQYRAKWIASKSDSFGISLSSDYA